MNYKCKLNLRVTAFHCFWTDDFFLPQTTCNLAYGNGEYLSAAAAAAPTTPGAAAPTTPGADDTASATAVDVATTANSTAAAAVAASTTADTAAKIRKLQRQRGCGYLSSATGGSRLNP